MTDGGTTTQNFSLAAAPTSACLTDTTQADFLTGVPTNVDLITSPGDVMLLNAPRIDQQNTPVTTSGFGFSTTSWVGQTFMPAVTGQLTQGRRRTLLQRLHGHDPEPHASRSAATSAGLPTGADLATATIPGFFERRRCLLHRALSAPGNADGRNDNTR